MRGRIKTPYFHQTLWELKQKSEMLNLQIMDTIKYISKYTFQIFMSLSSDVYVQWPDDYLQTEENSI